MVSLEDEHQLVWQVDKRFTTDVALCACGWRIWSPHKAEILEGHGVHLEHVRRRQAEADRKAWELECKDHLIRWNECRDGAGCTRCGWACFDTNTATILVSWNAHLEGLKTHGVL